MNHKDARYILPKGQGIFYMHQASILVDQCIVDHKYEQYHNKYAKSMKKLP